MSMGAFLQYLLTFVLLYKYAAIFILTFFAAMAVPIPSGALAVASFFFATQGYMNAPLIYLASASGNIAGDLLTFWLTRRYGVKVMRKIGFGRLLDARIVKGIEGKIDTHPVSTVFVSRLTTAVTPLVNVLAGFTKMPFRVFAAAAVAGEAVETGLNFLYGTFFGNQLASFINLIGLGGTLVLALALLLALLFWNHRRGRRFTR